MKEKTLEMEERFWKNAKEFTLRETTEKDFDYFFEVLKKNAWRCMGDSKISNKELQPIFHEILVILLKKIEEKGKMSNLSKE